MVIKEIKAKSIINKSKLPGADFVINPYIGCSHNCLYCYAVFMKRFTNHPEPWGSFVDIKINGPDLIPDNDKYKGKKILLSSVTDPYMPLESKYKITRKILEKLTPSQPDLDIITKSDLVLRDVDLLKKFNKCTVAISASFTDGAVKNKLESGSVSTERRLEALKELHKIGIRTVLFISPIFPEVSDWRKLIDMTKDYVDEYWFENLNLYPSTKRGISSFLKEYNLIDRYNEIYSSDNYWKKVEEDIEEYCFKRDLNYKIYFHHKK